MIFYYMNFVEFGNNIFIISNDKNEYMNMNYDMLYKNDNKNMVKFYMENTNVFVIILLKQLCCFIMMILNGVV